MYRYVGNTPDVSVFQSIVDAVLDVEKGQLAFMLVQCMFSNFISTPQLRRWIFLHGTYEYMALTSVICFLYFIDAWKQSTLGAGRNGRASKALQCLIGTLILS